MTKFSLEIVAEDDKVKINLPGGRTFGITATSSGAAFIPDWNDRHFTWAADETTGAPFHHITDETRDKKIAKVEYGSEDEYLYEMYSAYGGFGQLKPANWVNADYLWELDTDAYAEVLEEADVMKRSENRLWLSFTRLIAYVEQLAQDKEKLVEFLNRIYDDVGRRQAWESDSRLFFTPGFESFVLQRPDGYVMEMGMENPVDVISSMRSARAIDVMCQLFDDPAFSA